MALTDTHVLGAEVEAAPVAPVAEAAVAAVEVVENNVVAEDFDPAVLGSLSDKWAFVASVEDKTKPDTNVIKDKKTGTEKGSLDVTVNHDKLDKAVEEAKTAGVTVVEAPAKEKTVASDKVEEAKKEVEADYKAQETKVKEATDKYKEEVKIIEQELSEYLYPFKNEILSDGDIF